MNVENPLWGAPRIHGELLKLGFQVAQSSVAKYMDKRRRPPSQGWRTFLRNHRPDIAAMDLFVVPTIGFDLLYAFVIVRLDRRDLVWINVTANPTAEWVARQITEAFPWNEAPRYLIRDRDRIYGSDVTRRLRSMGIRDKPVAERIGHWTKTRRLLARFSAPEASVHTRYLVDFTITTSGYKFSVHTPNANRLTTAVTPPGRANSGRKYTATRSPGPGRAV
jgi:hypothetical protein